MLYQIVTGHQDLQAHIIDVRIISHRKSTQTWELEEYYLTNTVGQFACLRNQKVQNYIRQDSCCTVFQDTCGLTSIIHQYEDWNR